jgi:hypothetical protein
VSGRLVRKAHFAFNERKECVYDLDKGQGSSVGIVTDYGLEDRMIEVRIPAGVGIFLFTTTSRTALRPTQPPIQWVPEALSLGVKRPGSEANHLHLMPR